MDGVQMNHFSLAFQIIHLASLQQPLFEDYLLLFAFLFLFPVEVITHSVYQMMEKSIRGDLEKRVN